MDEARRKIRICLVCIVMIAVIVGIVYYMNDVMGSSDPDEGTLVRQDVSYTEEHAEAGGGRQDESFAGVHGVRNVWQQ